MSYENGQNIVLGIFWFVWNSWFWETSGLEFWWQWRALFKGFDDIWRFLGGHVEKYREKLFFWLRGGALRVFGCLVRMGKTQICASLLWFMWKRADFQNFACVAAENTVFSHMWADLWKFSVEPVGGGGWICTTMCFCWGHVGLVCLVVFVLFPSLGSKPSLFLLVSFWFFGVLVCVFLVWSLFVVLRIRQTYLS